MAIFNNMSITNKGQVLYAKAQAGQELHFTKMMVGSGNLDTRNPAALSALIEPKFDVGIQEITPNTELKTATISGTISNSGVTEATYICEIGLFAEDPDEGEILYAYGTAGQYGDYYAPASMGPFSWNYQINAAIGNAANVTIELSNLTYDYGVFNTNITFLRLTGGNQKEINKSIDIFIDNLYKLSEGTVYPVNASGTNDYTGIITGLKEYKEPLALAVKIPNDSTGACTININGLGAKAILKANGNAVTNLKANSIYTMRYNGTNFILQGEGGSGNATAADILAGKTASTDAGDVIGEIPIRGQLNKALSLNETYNLPSGYYSGGKITQNIATQGGSTTTPGTANKTIVSANKYVTGDIIVKGDANLIASNIISGKSIFGVSGNAKMSQSATGTQNVYGATAGTVYSINCGFQPSAIYLKGDIIAYKNSWIDENNVASFRIDITSTGFNLVYTRSSGSSLLKDVIWFAHS